MKSEAASFRVPGLGNGHHVTTSPWPVGQGSVSTGPGQGAALPAMVLKPRSVFHGAARIIFFQSHFSVQKLQ